MALSKRTKTNFIVLHCSATKPSQNFGAADIDRWHRSQGWLMIGYHAVIKRDGTVENGRPLDTIGAHVNPPAGINSTSVGVCMVGGVNEKTGKPENNFTPAQWKSLEEVVTRLEGMYLKAKIVGHGELSHDRACPSFNVQQWVKRRPKAKRLTTGTYTPTYLNGLIGDMPTLKLGDNGAAVKVAQTLLNGCFEVEDQLVVDGKFGPATERLVIIIQAWRALTQDGIIGPKTWAQLKQHKEIL